MGRKSVTLLLETGRQVLLLHQPGKTLGKRASATSAQVAGEALRSAAMGVQVPAHVRLRDCDRPFWAAIVRAREGARSPNCTARFRLPVFLARGRHRSKPLPALRRALRNAGGFEGSAVL